MNADEAEVLKLEQQFVAAWKAGDAKAAAAVFAEDGVRVGAFGDIQRGRQEVEAGYAKLFGGPMGGAAMEWTPTVRLISADVAVAEGPLTITPKGGSPIKGWASDLWKKRDGKWWCIEGNPKFFPPPPAKP